MKYCSVYFQRLLLVVFIALLPGCGGSSSSGTSGSDNSASDTATPKSVSGTAVKGVIANGIVRAYAIENGQTAETLVTTSTDTSGNYSLRIPGDYDGPVLISISVRDDGSTLMTCDAAGGCGVFSGLSELDGNQNGTIDFGEQFPLGNDFEISALVSASSLSAANHVDVTLLTHLAAVYAGSFPQGYDNLSAELAITQIASLFQLNDNLFTLNAPDITNSEDFASASPSEKRYGLLTSSLAALADSDSLSAVLASIESAFSLNNGQLVMRSSDADAMTLEKILQAAMNNLSWMQQSHNDNDLAIVDAAFQAMLADIEAAADGSLSSAEGSPGAGSSELEKSRQFIADLQQWQATLPVTTPDQPLVAAGYDLATGMDHYQSPLLQALALASQHAAIVAVPDLALEAACNSLTNLFARLLCQSIILKNSIEEICDATLNLSLFGVSLCEYLNDLTLPMGNGVWATYAIYDRNARIFGELEGVAIDVSFTDSVREGNTISFSIEGTVSDSESEMRINAGRITYRFGQTLTASTLQLPRSVSLELTLDSETLSDHESMEFRGTVLADVQLARITDEGQLGMGGVTYSHDFDGLFDYSSTSYAASGQAFSGRVTATNGNSAASVSASYDLVSQDMTQSAVLNIGTYHEFTLGWDGRLYRFTYAGQNPGDPLTQTVISNQDGVSLAVDYLAENGSEAGRLTIEGARYAEVTWVNGSLSFRLADNSETMLY
ncbi:MAG: hypothetical protein R3208_00460 [Ketobacteraceae bacterium]|nr:hypothetical protein [Ketobacteraceae bacterium]